VQGGFHGERLDGGTGAAAGILPDLPRLMEEYHALRDCDERGFPSAARLGRLGLSDVAADLAELP
jgi:aldehyde:ferredoxin oxidoreductase